ncbi:MAG: hypothetical protein JW833_17870, partial [Prolixibacteraceae bacterium]|nr:hypothetical protein [Prolixibacteraceae bacterium]
ILLSNQDINEVDTICHPVYPEKSTQISRLTSEELLKVVYSDQTIQINKKNPSEIFEDVKSRAEKLPEEHKRFVSPHIYKVGISKELLELKNKLLGDYKNKF